MRTKLIFVRHAESTGPFVPELDRTRGLSERGQASLIRMGEMMGEVQIDHVVSSPYQRAMLTVQGLADARGLPVVCYDALRERQLHGSEYPLAGEEFHGAIQQSFEDKHFALPGGESFEEAQQRALPVIKQLLREHQGQTVVIGTHGNIMVMLLNAFDERYDYTFWRSTTMPDLYEAEFEGEQLMEVRRLWS
ncbi:histidine phosphatase family protein [Paenibacillus sp. OV219]|uniref:histidine phosphatase family protein n=1 Tax=Paenibacillus sp. OV219 TaxID=1884377 RepID=UPI0008B3EB4A|nr:histidine phosphatase family protein [Paenibacillus sp. OV219]SEO41645.1 2,3-bisphosphoglycerate-dependent phosphoglycerate mutase [Paenibacillus sp. OV219]